MHGHMTAEQAERIEQQGLAEWLTSPVMSRTGEPKKLRTGEPAMRREPAIRLKRGREYRPTQVAEPGQRGLRTWQLAR